MDYTQEQKAIMFDGRCPFCGKYIKGWKTPFGSFAPEIWETLRERGIDPKSGHARDCEHKEIRI